MAGPLGLRLVRRLTDPDFGIVLDSWLDADGLPQGNAPVEPTDPPADPPADPPSAAPPIPNPNPARRED